MASFKTVAAFKAHLAALGGEGAALACDDELLTPSPLAQPLQHPALLAAGLKIGNRFAVQPMEGWDGALDGKPSPLTLRRWRNFGLSGAKLVWGGEALAVRHDGRANPNQLSYAEANRAALAELPEILRRAHRERFGSIDGLVLGLQLTHSGRYCRPEPDHLPRPRAAFRHPLLDVRYGVRGDGDVFTDGELAALVGDFAAAARFAREVGFQFVDVKHCHGYLLHELLGARTRPGAYGGSFEHRTRMLRDIVAAIRRDAPGLAIGVRLSAIDFAPFTKPALGAGAPGQHPPVGVPVDLTGMLPYPWGFGVNAERPQQVDLAEPSAFLRLCVALGIHLVNLTAGSPYYTPHLQRPALFPPTDGYPPPEDPLLSCARQLQAAAALKRTVPELLVVGTGYSYFQDFLPHVAQAQVRLGHVDAVGLGRMMLAYPDLAADVLEGRPLQRGRLCRTFSDCTNAPRQHMVSGCFPLDPFYKALPEAARLKLIKKQAQ